jgi:hypothetical protein
MTLDHYQDAIEAELQGQIDQIGNAIVIARQESDWSTWRLLHVRADGVRDALAGIRRLYLEQMRQTA